MPSNPRDNFFTTILPVTPQNDQNIFNRHSEDYARLAASIAQKPQRREASLYLLVLAILNMMSRDIHDEDGSQTLALAFKNPSSTRPGSQWSDHETKPNFVAEESERDHIEEVIEALQNQQSNLPKEVFTQCKNHEYIVSAGEGKIKQENDSGQLRTFASTVKQHRPDLKDVFCFFADFEGFTVARFNACGFVESTHQPWSLLEGLFQYVSALYTQPRGSVTFHAQVQCWRLRLGAQRYLLSPFYSSRGPGRMSTVFSACREKERTGEPGALVVKLIWRDLNRKHEGEFLKYLHRNGLVAGVVRIEEQFDLEGHVQDINGGIHRLLSGLVMKSTGDPLSQCQSVYHFLCVMYDLVQTLENCSKQGVISRDVSWHNVLCNPRHVGHPSQQMWQGNGKSINAILGEENTEYQCLLTDFDHGKILAEKRNKNPDERIGTPMFIPVEVLNDTGLMHWTSRRDLQELLADLFSSRELIEKVQAPDLAIKFPEVSKRFDPDHNHDFKDTKFPPGWKEYREHLPRHDVDSVLWIIIWWLSRTYPLHGDKELHSQHRYYLAWVNDMLNHRLEGWDRRERFRIADSSYFKELLHPDLQFLAGMLESMSLYLAGPWVYVDSESDDSWPQTHTHVVMKMLLMKEIIKLKNDDPLPVSRSPRPARPYISLEPTTPITTTTTGSSVTQAEPALKQLPKRNVQKHRTSQASRPDSPLPLTEDYIYNAKHVVATAGQRKAKLVQDRLFFSFTPK